MGNDSFALFLILFTPFSFTIAIHSTRISEKSYRSKKMLVSIFLFLIIGPLHGVVEAEHSSEFMDWEAPFSYGWSSPSRNQFCTGCVAIWLLSSTWTRWKSNLEGPVHEVNQTVRIDLICEIVALILIVRLISIRFLLLLFVCSQSPRRVFQYGWQSNRA